MGIGPQIHRERDAKRIWKIQFRNVGAPLPPFVETFMDDGYYDMWYITKALQDYTQLTDSPV